MEVSVETRILYRVECDGTQYYYTRGSDASDKRRICRSCEKIYTIIARRRKEKYFVGNEEVQVNVDILEIHKMNDANETEPIRFHDERTQWVLRVGGKS